MWNKNALLSIPLMFLVSCAGSGKVSDHVAEEDTVRSEGMFAMPTVPDSITDPQARADYLLYHFWDNADFSDRGLLRDSVMLEQAMSNFISVMDFTSGPGLQRGVNRLLETSEKESGKTYSRIIEIADLYLWNAESPFRNEVYYHAFVSYEIMRGGEGAERARYRLAEIERNRPGSMAPGFELESIDGGTIAFRPGTGGRVAVLMFYDPDCDHCGDVIEAMRADMGLSRAIGSGEIRMIAAYIGTDYELWQRHAVTLPANWEIGIDRKMKIDSEDLYVVRATPSIYLIGREGEIILKDSDFAHLAEALGL